MKKILLAAIIVFSCSVYPLKAQNNTAQWQGWLNLNKFWAGTVQSSNSRYTEQSVIPLRFTATLSSGSTHTVVLKYDFSSGNSRFIDSLGSYNATEAAADPTANFTGLGSPVLIAIPTDSSLNKPGAQTAGNFTTYNISSLTPATSYSLANGVKSLSITFTVARGGGPTKTVVIACGAHLASDSVWGPGSGASTFPGASRKAFASLDGASAMNVSINPGAIIPSADLALSTSASPQPLISGANATFSINVTNSGPDKAILIFVTNTLPSGVTFVSASPAPAFIAGQNISFALGTIGALASSNITLIGTVTSGQCVTLTNSTFVVSATSDPNSLNNSNSVIATIADTSAPLIACSDIPPLSATADANCVATIPDVRPLVRAHSSDICTPQGSLTVTQTPAAGTPVGVGITTIIVTVKDAANNASTCSTSFIVTDKTTPGITCPGNVTLNTSASSCAALAGNIDPILSDNCTGVHVTYSLSGATTGQGTGSASNISFNKGVTTVTYNATDASGNPAHCDFTVTVLDKEVPAIACPADITLPATSGLCGAAATYDCPTATDNCDGSVAVTCTPPPGTFLPIGTNVVVCTATDSAGNTGSCLFFVVVTDETNQSWPQAQNLLLGAAGSDGFKQATANQCLVSLDQSRWYKFKVTPGSRVTVTLTQLAENYDLVLYKDIAQAFAKLSTETDVTHLSAQFASDAFSPSAFSPSAFSPSAFSPSAFSPSAFSPSAFSPSAFSPSAFSPSAFSPSAFSPDAFAPSAFSPSAFSPSAFSPSAFSPSAFSPSAFSPSAFSPSAFSAAQVQSILAGSAFEGVYSEGVIADTWDNTGDFYVRVRGRNGVFSPGNPFLLTVYELPGACEGVTTVPVGSGNHPLPASQISAPIGEFQTIIVTDTTRWPQGTDITAMMSKLGQLAAQANGVVVDVATDPWVTFFNHQADQNYGCPFAKNLVASAIKGIIDRSRTPALKYVVIVGSDNIIPFFRYPDEALLGPEKNYVPPVKDATASQASLRLNYVYNQDYYGSQCNLRLKNVDLPLPDLAVGRLVETPDEVIGMVDAFLNAPAGGVPVNSSLVTGYDFLADSSTEMAFQLQQGIGGSNNDTLICQNDQAPSLCWTADDLRSKLFGLRHDIVYLAGHFSAISALAADYQTSILASELAESSTSFENSLLISPGCHSGYNIVTGDQIQFVTLNPDWARAAARKHATLVAGTGYQYGDTDFIEFSERLYLEFTKQLRTSSSPDAVAAGDALKQAKLVYLAGTPQIRSGGIHTKAYLEATLYGLPMLRFNIQAKLPPTSTPSVVASTTPYLSEPGLSLGLLSADLTVTPQLTERTVNLVDTDSDATVQAFFVQGGDGVMSNPAEPVLPVEIRSVGVDGTVLRGVGFREATYLDVPGKIPLTSAATTEIRGVHANFHSEAFYPMRFWNVNYFGALCGLGDGATRLTAIPAQFQSDSATSNTGTVRKFSTMNFRLYYNNNLQDYGDPGFPSIPGISGPPSISDIRGITNPEHSEVALSARVIGSPAAGIQSVWVTFTAQSGQYHGKWRPIDLVQNQDDSTLWEGTLPLNGTDSQAIRYMVQAVNGVGLVAVDLKLGAYHVPDEFDAANTAQLTPTHVEILQNPGTKAYADTVEFQAKLSVGQTPLPNQHLVFSVGDQAVWTTTDANGVGTANMRLKVAAAQYDIKASFAGSTGFAPSFDSQPFEVARQTTVATLNKTIVYVKPGADSGIVTTLKDSLGNSISERTLFFIIHQGPTVASARTAITDMSGRAPFGKIGPELADGTYTVSVYFDGSIPLPDGTTVTLDDGLYFPLSTVGTINVVQMVVDGTSPSFACTDLIVNTDPNSCFATVALDGASLTTFDANIDTIIFNPPGPIFPKGLTPVTCIATDKAGNQATCNFSVDVTDGQNPTVLCPADVVTVTPADNCSVVVNNIDATTSDNCPGVILSYTLSGDTVGSGTGRASGISFNKGVTTVTYTTTDFGGNSASCNFTVTVNDTTPPVVSGCPGNIGAATGPNRATCDAVVAWNEPTATDNCGGAVPFFSRTKAPGDTFPLGTTVVTYVFKDAAGNQSSCTFNVTVVDTTPPTIACPGNITATTSGSGAVVNFTVTASDNCGATTVKSVPASGSTFPIGTTTVISTATDSAGNSVSCNFTVTVSDVAAPVITGLSASPNRLSPPNHQMMLVTVTVNATDNSSGAITSSISSVTSNEPINGTGDGDQSPDWQLIPGTINSYPGTLQVWLRSERAQNGKGRTYTITVTSTDVAGNLTSKIVTVSVPKNS